MKDSAFGKVQHPAHTSIDTRLIVARVPSSCLHSHAYWLATFDESRQRASSGTIFHTLLLPASETSSPIQSGVKRANFRAMATLRIPKMYLRTSPKLSSHD